MSRLEEISHAKTQRMHAARKEHSECVERAARAKVDYKVARATALLKAEGTVAIKDAKADLASADELLQKELNEGLAASALEAVRNSREEVGLWRALIYASKDGVAVEYALADVS